MDREDDNPPTNAGEKRVSQPARRWKSEGGVKVFRVLLTAAVAGLAGYLIAPSSVVAPAHKAAPLAQQPAPPPQPADLPADADLSPLEVVQEQMQALATCRHTPAASARVFAFASPPNKAATGPLERFEKMLWQPPFDRLIINEGWSTGRAVEQDGVAAVLVLTIQSSGETAGFRFYLSRQEDESPGRWMTDAVIPLQKSKVHEPLADFRAI